MRPTLPEVPPGFWEQYGLLISVLAVLVLGTLGALVWLVARKRPAPPEAPANVARKELLHLREAPVDTRLLSKVSHVLKQYLAAAFDLPKEELTTAEFCQVLALKERAGPELTDRAVTLLHVWDEQKFSPAPSSTTEKPVEQASELVDLGERRLAELRQAEQAMEQQAASQNPTT